MSISKIGTAKSVQNIIDQLQEKDDTEELVIIRSYRDKQTGEKKLEWWSSEIESRVWTTGALHYLAYKLLMSDPDET